MYILSRICLILCATLVSRTIAMYHFAFGLINILLSQSTPNVIFHLIHLVLALFSILFLISLFLWITNPIIEILITLELPLLRSIIEVDCFGVSGLKLQIR